MTPSDLRPSRLSKAGTLLPRGAVFGLRTWALLLGASFCFYLCAEHAAEEGKPAKTGAAAAGAVQEGADWKVLFNGKDLKGWIVTDFAGHADVAVNADFKGKPALVAEMGLALSGITWTNAFPTNDYEVELQAMKLAGNDFLCGLTFPVKDSWCTLVLGGWGGAVVGLSNIDGADASENETTKFMRFEKDQWYSVRVRVAGDKIQAWIDGELLVDLSTKERRISLRPGEIDASRPFGIAAYQTRAAWREIRVRGLGGGAAAAGK